MRTARAAAALVALSLLSGCGDAVEETAPDDLDAIDVSVDATITVDEDGFDPAALEVRSGDAIELVNAGDEPHAFRGGERFETGRMEPGETVTLVLDEPGEITYTDRFEPGHVGSITVTAR